MPAGVAERIGAGQPAGTGLLIKAGPEALRQELRTWSEHVRTLMTLLGAANVSQLRRTDVLVTGSTAERARLLGVDLTGLAHRSDS